MWRCCTSTNKLLVVLLVLQCYYVVRVHAQDGGMIPYQAAGAIINNDPDVLRQVFVGPDQGGPLMMMRHRHRLRRHRRGNPLPGILVAAGSSVLLWWNEGRAVRHAQMLQRAQEVVVSIEDDDDDDANIDPSNDGRLVHVTGPIATHHGMTDPDFGMHRPKALRLQRVTEGYQWIEAQSKRKTRGRVEMTDRYHTDWTSRKQDSSTFALGQGHANPEPKLALGVTSQTVEDATLANGLSVPPGLVQRLRRFEEVSLGSSTSTTGTPLLYDDDAGLLIAGNTLYLLMLLEDNDPTPPSRLLLELDNSNSTHSNHSSSKRATSDPNQIRILPVMSDRTSTLPTPSVGDVRVTWQEVAAPSAGVSLLAQQQDGVLVPWIDDRTGHRIYSMEEGSWTAAEMMQHLLGNRKRITTIVRVGGVVGNMLGFLGIGSWWSGMLSSISFLTPLVGVTTSIVAVGGSLGLSAAVVCAAWLRFRPVVAAGLFVVSTALGVYYGPLSSAAAKSKRNVDHT